MNKLSRGNLSSNFVAPQFKEKTVGKKEKEEKRRKKKNRLPSSLL